MLKPKRFSNTFVTTSPNVTLSRAKGLSASPGLRFFGRRGDLRMTEKTGSGKFCAFAILITLVTLVTLPLYAAPKKRTAVQAAQSKKSEEQKKTYEKQLDADLQGPNAQMSTGANLVGSGQLFKTFDAIAKEYKLPTDILLAISFHESGFQMKKPNPKTKTTGWGLMGLGGASNPSTLTEGARLLEKDAETLRTDPAANIRASAAVLTDLKVKILGKKKSQNPKFKDYHKVIKRYAGTGDNFLDQTFADEIFMLLKTGTTYTLESSEVITIEASLELMEFEPAPLLE